MSDMRPVCVPCNRRYICEKNGVTVLYAEDTVQAGDLWKCPSCYHQIVTGFSINTISRWQYVEEHMHIFESYLARVVARPYPDGEI